MLCNNTKNIMNSTINKIKQSSLCCVYCGKSYKTKSYLDKHILICEIWHKSKNKTNSNNSNNSNHYQNNDNDEDFVVPSQKQMYQIILDLAFKCNRLENKVSELNKFMTKKIKKIDVLEFLNNDLQKPNIIFDNMTDLIKVNQSDIEYLFNNSFLETVNHILSRNIYKNEDEIINTYILPITCFIQKPNNIYIYDKSNSQTQENNHSWQIISREKLIRFLNIIQFKISKSFSEWRKTNGQILLDNDSASILYDKTFSKLMAPEFKKDVTYNKYYNNIYNKIKKDVNMYIVDIDF
jgi:hypothetical protein